MNKMRLKELFLISNLFSIFRVLIIPALWFYISRPDDLSGYIAVAILIMAGISDGLDGFLARKLNQVSKLGLVLDPLADKILAAALVIMLICYRDFSIWLAAMIIGRDLMILGVAAVLLKGKQLVVPSTITGKYTFFYIVALLSCSVIRYEFGVEVLSVITKVLIVASITIYLQNYRKIKTGESLFTFRDLKIYQVMRVGLTAAVMTFLLIKLYFQF